MNYETAIKYASIFVVRKKPPYSINNKPTGTHLRVQSKELGYQQSPYDVRLFSLKFKPNYHSIFSFERLKYHTYHPRNSGDFSVKSPPLLSLQARTC